jgi:Ca2+-binding EF-hand superfamily protein
MSKQKKIRISMDLSPKEIAALLKASQISEEEIQHWHQDFLDHSPSGQLDKKAFIEYYKKLNPREETTDSFEGIFDTIDINKDGTIDFNEFLVVVVLLNRVNDLEARLSFVFDMWDESDDGHIDQKELANVITAIYDRTGITDRKGERDPKKRAKEIIAKLDVSGDKKLSKEEFITGCKNDSVIRDLLTSN